VYGLALRILRDEKAAEEATVEVFVRVWTRAATFDPERGKVLAWVLTMARSAALEALRARRREGARARLETSIPRPVARSARRGQKARRRAGRGCAQGIAAASRSASCARPSSAALSYREVAEVFGQPLGTVKTRIRAGLAALRRALAPEGECAMERRIDAPLTTPSDGALELGGALRALGARHGESSRRWSATAASVERSGPR
jgi:RNA polymerase sigma-70 factor (ECF subfamily)